jgi:hypothetical protein
MYSSSPKPTLYDTANYFQTQANRTRDPDRKAHYQRCADEHRAKAKEPEPQADKRRQFTPTDHRSGPADSRS